MRTLLKQARPIVAQAVSLPIQVANKATNEVAAVAYSLRGRKPWSLGYLQHRDRLIAKTINDSSMMDCFAKEKDLPGSYGEFMDERVVELPWCLAQLETVDGAILDAGSSLNFPHIVDHKALATKSLTIATLEPEKWAFWRKRISYQYCDFRELPFRDDHFDAIACISTLEHVGMDNSIYSDNEAFQEQAQDDFTKVISEFRRALKPSGQLLVTVPFGQNISYGWYQQFDGPMIDRLIKTFSPSESSETYFSYSNLAVGTSHSASTARTRSDSTFTKRVTSIPNSSKDYDDDFAACSRAIAAVRLTK